MAMLNPWPSTNPIRRYIHTSCRVVIIDAKSAGVPVKFRENREARASQAQP